MQAEARARAEVDQGEGPVGRDVGEDGEHVGAASDLVHLVPVLAAQPGELGGVLPGERGQGGPEPGVQRRLPGARRREVPRERGRPDAGDETAQGRAEQQRG